jgi:hypothetical protein
LTFTLLTAIYQVKATAEYEDAGSGDDMAATPATPATAPPAATASSSKKRVAKADKGDTETPTKKRKTKAEANGDAETPAKTTKAKATPKKTPAKGNKFPESSEEFTDGDRLILSMRKDGKGWDEINEAWEKVTGQKPGKDVLRKREPKLKAVATEWKVGEVSLPLIPFDHHAFIYDLLLTHLSRLVSWPSSRLRLRERSLLPSRNSRRNVLLLSRS